MRDPEAFWTALGVIAWVALAAVLVGVHFRQQKREKRTEEEAVLIAEVVPTLPPLVPLKSPAEIAEVDDKTLWLHTMAEAMTVPDDLTGARLNLDQPAAEALLCDQPDRPPHGSEAWLTIRIAELRHRPVQLRWERLTAAIGSDWAALVAEEEELTRAADMAEWEHLTETALTDTQEITVEMRAAVFGGVR